MFDLLHLWYRLLMGVLSPNQSSAVFPWFRADHPLQHNVPLQLGWKVGFCGCLTTCKVIFAYFAAGIEKAIHLQTFSLGASWNTQMIVMMDGTVTALPPQIGQSLTGYVIGITCCIASFIFGQSLRNPGRPSEAFSGASAEGTHEHTLESIDIIEGSTATKSSEEKGSLSCCTISHVAPLTLVILLLVGYGLGDGLSGLADYRTMWMSSIVAPFGAVMRWRLSALNPVSSPDWFPTGTLIANTMAVVLGAAAEALESRISSGTSERLLWVSPMLLAIEIGFAGSLSTVSTLVRELAFMKTPGRAIVYFSATAMISMSIGLVVYSPTIRAGQS
jgi:fluoride ion exporter CrcB/FEX